MNFAVLWLFVKVFSAKFGGVVSFGAAQRAIRESFLQKSYLSPICESFLPRKFPAIRYKQSGCNVAFVISLVVSQIMKSVAEENVVQQHHS